MRGLRVVLLGALLLLLAGCANPNVNITEFYRIEKGWPIERVVQRLGPETRRKGQQLYFKGRYGTIVLEIREGRIVKKRWEEPD